MSHRTILLGVIIVMAQHGAAQSWSFNEKESYVVFIAKNLGMKVSGKITGMKIASNYDGKNIKTTTFSGSIDVSTIDTQIQMRDNHLKSSDYFDVQKYPIIEFKSKEVVEEGSALKVIGNVIIKGITKEIEVVFTIQKNGGKHTFVGNVIIQRKDFDLGSSTTAIMADTIVVRIFAVFDSN